MKPLYDKPRNISESQAGGLVEKAELLVKIAREIPSK